jgi:predicted transposase/invertase (TIGR01784 family)
MAHPPPREHDTAYRGLFTHPELVEDLLRHFVKEPWVDEIDFTSLQRESEISVVRRRGAKIRDVVWSVRFSDRTLYILILIEFQSRLDPIMALRHLEYVAGFYKDLYLQERLSVDGKLPPVLPVVLYNGDLPWRAPCSVEEMIEAVPEPLARYQPRMSYFLLDERRAEFELDQNQRNTVAALLALEQSRVGDEVFEVVLFLVNSLREPKHESLRQAFKDHILKVLSPDFAPIAEVFDYPEDPMTTRERLKIWYDEQQAASRAEGVKEGVTQGVQQGLEQGVKKGIKQGRVEGQRSLLAKQLKLKFGTLDAFAKSRLTDATSEQLDKWAERVLTAGSLDEVWA